MFKLELPRITPIIVGIIFLISVSNAETPNTINYQGRLTDRTTGDPITGTVDLLFNIYNCESCTNAGSVLWTESHTSVPVDGGLFDVIMGSNTPIPDTAFNKAARWLGITVNTDPEILPRTEFTSVAYSYRALVADSLSEDTYLKENGDTLTGTLFFNGGGGAGGYLQVGADAANLVLSTNDAAKSRIYGELFGEITLYDGDGTVTANVNAHNSTGGELKLFDSDGTTEIELYAGAASNDAKVTLPDNSVNSDEILNEPGLAHGTASMVFLTTSMTDITSVDVNIPAAGYVYVLGRCDVFIYDHTENSGVTLNIYSTADSTVGDWLCFTGLPAGLDRREPAVVDAVFYCSSSGSYTFALEGYKLIASGSASAMNVSLTAIYIPTSYGAVTTMVNNPGDNPNPVPVPIYDQEGNPTGDTRYEVDLRYYELKAKEAQLQEREARIRTLEAELELQRARDRVDSE